MTEQTHTEENVTENVVAQAPESVEVVETAETVSATSTVAPTSDTQRPAGFRRGAPRGRGPRTPDGKSGDRRGGPRREPRAKPEYDQKIIDIRRVTRVASGGRRFSFAVSMVAGDRRGKVGVGTGKGLDTAIAVEKAFRDAKKNMIQVYTTKSGSIPHDVQAKYSSARVEIIPAPGKGMIAGSAVRDVLDHAGIKDVVAKLRSGTKNKLNNARVALRALSLLKKPKSSAHKAKSA